MDRIQPSLFTHVSRKKLFAGNNMTNQLAPGSKSMMMRESDICKYFGTTSTMNEDEENHIFLISYASFTKYKTGRAILKRSMLGDMHDIFLKYLRCRCKHTKFPWRLEVISFVASTFTAISGRWKNRCTTDSFWHMLGVQGLLFNNILLTRTKEQFESWTPMPNTVRSLEELCLFGEFLYISLMIGESHSNDVEMVVKAKESTNRELELMEDIWNSISPRLALMIFIVFRNWSANGISIEANGEYVNTFRESFIYPPLDEELEMYTNVHVAYCSLWDDKIISHRMEGYFRAFILYFGSHMCQSHHFFGRQVIGMNYDMAFKLSKGQCDHDKNKELEHILLNVLEILYFFQVKKESFEFADFQDIPIFLETKALKEHFDCGNPSLKPLLYDHRSANSLLIAISLFVDFLFFEDWKCGLFKIDFMEIWGRLNRDISTRCEAIQEFVASYHLFPFFEKSPNLACNLSDRVVDKSLSCPKIDSPPRGDADFDFEF